MSEPVGRGGKTRRDRLRAATREEILQTARTLLLRDGPASVSLRAIAREMGMTAPGLYRYFASHEELVRNVAAGIFTELAAEIEQAIAQAVASHAEPGKDKDPAQLGAELLAACRAFRGWALSHRAEFSLLFGVPLPELNGDGFDIAEECALRFAGVYLGLFTQLWEMRRFPVSPDDEIDPGLREQLTRHSEAMGSDMPLGAMLVFVRMWMLLYGAVAMEVFGHLSFAVDDASPLFELTLRDMAAAIGLRYQPS